jgi:hypothetical protein
MQSSCHLNSSRRVGPYSSSELNSLLAKGVVSPPIVLWMLGTCSRSALRDDETRKRPQNWKIAALVVTIFCGGIAIAGTLSTGRESGAAITIRSTQEIQDRKQPQITEKVKSNINRSKFLVQDRSNSSQISASSSPIVLSAQAAPVARATLSPQRQLVQEFRRSIGYSHVIVRYKHYLQAAPVARATLSLQRQLVQESERSAGSSHVIGRYRHYLQAAPAARAILPPQPQPVQESHRSAPAARAILPPQPQPVQESHRSAPVARAILPPQPQLAQESQRSIGSSHAIESDGHYLDGYSSGTLADIATARIDELQTTTRQDVDSSEAVTAKGKARTSSSKIPKPIPKPRISVRTTPGKLSTKLSPGKAKGRCWKGFIWGC